MELILLYLSVFMVAASLILIKKNQKVSTILFILGAILFGVSVLLNNSAVGWIFVGAGVARGVAYFLNK